MGIKIKSCNQAQKFESKLKSDLYKNLYKNAQKTQWIRLTGPAVGLTSGFLTITTRVALIGENFLKAGINIVGSPFYADCKFLDGLKQLGWHVPKNIIILPFSIGSAIFEVFGLTLAIAYFPSEALYNLWCANDPEEKKVYEKEFFGKAYEKAKTDPNIANWIRLADCHEKGIGTAVDPAKELHCQINAASLGDVKQMMKVAEKYYKSGKLPKALFWFQKVEQSNSVYSYFVKKKITKIRKELNERGSMPDFREVMDDIDMFDLMMETD